MSQPGPDLRGRRALVTGASKGIGAGIALALARAGADVAVNYRSDAAGAEDVARQARDLGRAAVAIGADVARVADCRRLVREAADALGGLDILVNNAGITVWEDFFATDEAHWDATLDTNLKGTFFCAQAAAEVMRERGWGRVVNISSGASRSAFKRATPYNASKGGVNMLTVGLAVELGPYGITVNAVAPGAILIERTSRELPDYAGTFAALTPLGRVGYPEDIAGAVLYFCSDAAAYVTGQVFWVDGGLFLRAGNVGDENRSNE
ncbi:MAG TPA: 3-oxoacyl-ACP reductase family protein [Thermomicrobiales bacterium]|nr:3-oxoacyl-ACP reductase family protein [Thermomicrobiales bacterium]